MSRRRLQVERPRQVHGGFSHPHLLEGGSQVDHVTLFLAARLEATKCVLVEIDAEGWTAAIGALDRAGSAPLRSGVAQARRQRLVGGRERRRRNARSARYRCRRLRFIKEKVERKKAKVGVDFLLFTFSFLLFPLTWIDNNIQPDRTGTPLSARCRHFDRSGC